MRVPSSRVIVASRPQSRGAGATSARKSFFPKVKSQPVATGDQSGFCGHYITHPGARTFFVLAMKPSAAALVCGLVWTRGLPFWLTIS